MSTPKTVNLVNNLNEKMLFVKVLVFFVFKVFWGVAKSGFGKSCGCKSILPQELCESVK